MQSISLYLDGDRHCVHGLVADLEAPDVQHSHAGHVLLDQDGQTENEVLCLMLALECDLTFLAMRLSS
jgi:hypothetical protein